MSSAVRPPDGARSAGAPTALMAACLKSEPMLATERTALASGTGSWTYSGIRPRNARSATTRGFPGVDRWFLTWLNPFFGWAETASDRLDVFVVDEIPRSRSPGASDEAGGAPP